ncbi:MAG: hypothetical protein RLO50_00320 [Azospirillaceae bacterium]
MIRSALRPLPVLLAAATALAACNPGDQRFGQPPAEGVSRLDVVLLVDADWVQRASSGVDASYSLQGTARHVAGLPVIEEAAVSCQGAAFSAQRYRPDDRGSCTVIADRGGFTFDFTVSGHLSAGLNGTGTITGGDGPFAGNSGTVFIQTDRIAGRHVESITVRTDVQWAPVPQTPDAEAAAATGS